MQDCVHQQYMVIIIVTVVVLVCLACASSAVHQLNAGADEILD